jgi:hypothetical protein
LPFGASGNGQVGLLWGHRALRIHCNHCSHGTLEKCGDIHEADGGDDYVVGGEEERDGGGDGASSEAPEVVEVEVLVNSTSASA